MKIIKRTKTLVDQAFNALKARITTWKIKAGETVPEEKTRNDLRVIRTLLRDALSRFKVNIVDALENKNVIRVKK